MIKHKQKGEFIIISGTTCAGKGTVIEKLLAKDKNLALSISYTSRAKRDGEVDGVDYHFISRDEFEKRIQKGEFLEYAKVRYGEYFGTAKKDVQKLLETGKDVIDAATKQEAKNIYQKVHNAVTKSIPKFFTDTSRKFKN